MLAAVGPTVDSPQGPGERDIVCVLLILRLSLSLIAVNVIDRR